MIKNSQPLPRHLTKGTRTFHLPFNREGQHPAITLVIRRGEDDLLQAGLAVCHSNDRYARRAGRRVALHRLAGCPLEARSALELIEQVETRLGQILERRRKKQREDSTLPAAIRDLELLQDLNETFQEIPGCAARGGLCHELGGEG